MSEDHPSFPNLFSPFSIGGVTLRNRIAISAHHGGWFVDRGLPSDELIAYLEERAKGGVGLFVIGATTPEPCHGCIENVDEKIVPRYRRWLMRDIDMGPRSWPSSFMPASGHCPVRRSCRRRRRYHPHSRSIAIHRALNRRSSACAR